MKYLFLVGSEGLAAPQEVAVMQREIPGWAEEMERRGVLLFGRPLDLPQTAAMVRVRDGETLVSDGPFAEAKEWIAGFDLVECADLDEAIEVPAKGPVSWFKTIEIRPFADGPWLGEGASAFGRGEDGATSPYLLAVWTGGTAAAPPGDQAVTREVKPAAQRAPGTAFRDERGRAVPAPTQTRAICAHEPHLLAQHLAGAYSAGSLELREVIDTFRYRL